MKRFVLGLLAVMLITLSIWSASPAQAEGCLFFTETGQGQGGYSVCDDAQANFRSAFEDWGLQKVGYPISQRYMRAGFVTQAFQKAIMQWRPDGDYVALVNIFDDLHKDGFDQQLLEMRQTPKQLPDGWDGEGLAFAEVISKRQALLDSRPALHSTYFAASYPLTFYGLPTSEIQDMGNHYAIRLQRAVLQEWKEDVPWAAKGQVTIANGGDIAKELGGLPTDALTPEASAPSPTQVPAAPMPTATSQPAATPVPTAAPQPTSEPVVQLPPPSFNECQMDPNTALAPNNPVKIISVLKGDTPEVVQLKNVSSNTVDLTGWRMCSIKGNQEHTGISGSLAPGEVKQFAYTGSGSIWSNSDKDDGALYNANGQIVSYWQDPSN